MIIELFTSAFQALTLFAGVSLQAALCVALILALHRALGARLPARWRYALWGVLLVRLLVPLNLPPVLIPVSWADAPPSALTITEPRTMSSRAMPPVRSDAREMAPVQAPVPMAPAAAQADARSLIVHWREMLAAAWLLGAAAVIVWTWGRHRRSIHQLRAEAKPPPSWVADLAGDVRRELGLARAPALWVADGLPSPVLMGALRPTIFLPRGLVAHTSAEQMRFILLHELCHVRARDIWFSWVWVVALSLHWFNPLLWMVGARIARDRELACDERVLRRIGPTKKTDYCAVLLHAAAQCTRVQPSRAVPGLAGIAERTHEIERRLLMLNRREMNSLSARMAAWGSAVLLVAVSFAQVGIVSAAESRLPEPAQPVEISVSDEMRLAEMRNASADAGDLIAACEAEMRRVALRGESGHTYKDKIDLADIYSRVRAAHPELTTERKEAMLHSLHAYADQHSDDPDYGWRVWHLCAAIAADMGDAQRARDYMEQSLADYPRVRYSSPSQQSKFQHLVNEAGMLMWDEYGVERAEDYLAQKWAQDHRFVYFFDSPWRRRYLEEGLGPERLETLKDRLGEKSPLRRIALLLTPEGLLHEGTPVAWEDVAARLAAIEDPENCILELGITTDLITVRALDAAQAHAMNLVDEIGLDHFSYIGVQAGNG
mgnify:CR=1 FL=1